MKGLNGILLLKNNDTSSKSRNKRADQADVIHRARLGTFSANAAKYTSSVDIDKRILEAVVHINMAHALMLLQQKIISKPSASQILIALRSVPRDLKLNELLEDVHMNVEDYVISKTGKESGGMLNLAKSRNDQVATALRIALREELLVLIDELMALERVLLARALEEASAVMPGYTHLQKAQPVTTGHQLLAHQEIFERDLERLFQCYSRVNKCPMGAGALASSSFPLNRKAVASFLGFDGLVENSLDAVSARDFVIESIYVCAQIMADVSKLAEEIILWTSAEFSFATISDNFAATSSMMPQKKNPIVPEVARAKTAQVVGELTAALGIVKALPLSYNLDLQELTRNLWSATDKTRDTLQLFSQMIKELKFDEEAMRRAVESDETLFATEVADYLVKKHGIPFRDAHARVGALVKQAEFLGHIKDAFTGIPAEEISSILGIKISKEELTELTDPLTVLSKRNTVGSPNPKLVKESCKTHSLIVSRQERRLNKLKQQSIRSKNELLLRVDREVGSFLTVKKNVEHAKTTKIESLEIQGPEVKIKR